MKKESLWSTYFKNKKNNPYPTNQNKNLTISKSDKIFTIGSCFANNLRLSLEDRGLECYPKINNGSILEILGKHSTEIPSWGKYDERVHHQHYNTKSILQELSLISDNKFKCNRDIFFVEKKNIYQCPYRRRFFAETIDELIEARTLFDSIILESLYECNVFILTFGMTETWISSKTEYTLNAAPGYGGGGGRLSSKFINTNYEQNLENIKNIFSQIKSINTKNKIFFSISPIPLAMTYTDDHILVANSRSKSTLLAAAHEAAKLYDDIIYYPSYEIATSNSNFFSSHDGRHADQKEVNKIINNFYNNYIKE